MGTGAHAQGAAPSSAPPAAAPSTQAPQTITLQDALALARKNSVDFQAALTEQGFVHQDKVQARAALLPTVSYGTQYLYSQGNGTPIVRFIANNAVHEYISQGDVHEVLAYSGVADYARSRALEAAARAKAEIAARGLVVTVVQSYYGLLTAQRKYATNQAAAAESERFLKISRQLESGGEVAHSDVIKAQIQYQSGQRDLREAQLAMDKSRLDLAVLLFPNFNENFTVVDDLDLAPPLPSFEEFVKMAEAKNPDLRVSTALLQAAEYGVSSARAAYFPNLTLDYLYGIDATHFAVKTNRLRNLGYQASATLSIPIWNWGATHAKVVQADLRRKQSERELSLAQRKLLAAIRNSFAEAQTSLSELDLLKSSADLAAESLKLTTLRYQAGEATVLEVVDAQNTLNLSRNTYSDGVVRYRAALAGLQTLTGTM
ncbi:MAG TPA: TolC family protein, partial [Candidatus Solibacter sp.]|nr:TolC family protein [Candidatus Solibacter sp.]